MIERDGHFVDLAYRLLRGHRFCTAMLLMIALLCVSSALSADVVTPSCTPSTVKSAGPVDCVKKTGASVEAKNFPSYRPTLQKGTLLVAGRHLGDANFARTVVLLVDYGAYGAMGLIINRPTRLSLGKAFPAIVPLLSRQHKLYIGGPVAQEQIVLLLCSDRQLQDTAHVFANIFFSASEDTLRQLLARSDDRERFHAYVGYAGWGPGQLEQEVMRGDWHLVSPDARTVFDAEPSEIWHELLRQSAGLWVQRRGYSLAAMHHRRAIAEALLPPTMGAKVLESPG